MSAGLVMVYSSSFIYALDKYKDGMHFFKKHLLYMGFGLIAFLVGWKFPLHKLKEKAHWIFFGVLGLLLLTLVPGFSQKAGGASRWLNLFGFVFQPSELVKVAVIVCVAKLISKKIHRQDNWRSGFLTYFIGTTPFYIMLMLQPDFGTTALCLAVTFLMLLASGAKKRYLFTSVSLLAPIASYLILSSPYRKARVLGFLDPWSDPQHKGFQVIQSYLAFYSGKFFGVGIGNSKEKLFYLPEAHNDFIFAVIGEELGLIGVLFFVSLFLVLIFRGIKAMDKQAYPFERALAAGITSLIGMQAFFNMAVVLGLLPTKGLPLPLISYGGTALITNLFLLGLLAQLAEFREEYRL